MSSFSEYSFTLIYIDSINDENAAWASIFFLCTLDTQSGFMKKLMVLMVLITMFACAENAPKEAEKISSSNVKTEIDTVYSEPETQTEVKELAVLLPTDGKLSCKSLGEMEYAPVYEVYVSFEEKKQKIGKCNACLDIPKSDYSSHEVPENAIAARGGWYAGGGDYFYSIRDEDGNLAVYQGWQDEGQAEEDFSFHWKLIKTFKLK